MLLMIILLWLKKEMYIDFNQDDYKTVEDYISAIT